MKSLEVFKFKEVPVTFIDWKGRPAVIAQDLGRALGYSEDGGELVRTIRKHWTDELNPGDDVVVLAGPELELFKGDLRVGGQKPRTSQNSDIHINDALCRLSEDLRFASSITLLFEGGIYVVALKTEKPYGKELRRWLKSEVLPSIFKTGSYEAPSGQRIKGERRPSLSPEEQESRRLTQLAQLVEKSGDKARARQLYHQASHVLDPVLIPDNTWKGPAGPTAEDNFSSYYLRKISMVLFLVTSCNHG